MRRIFLQKNVEFITCITYLLNLSLKYKIKYKLIFCRQILGKMFEKEIKNKKDFFYVFFFNIINVNGLYKYAYLNINCTILFLLKQNNIFINI